MFHSTTQYKEGMGLPGLYPYWVTGFADGESSFTTSIWKTNKGPTGWGMILWLCFLIVVNKYWFADWVVEKKCRNKALHRQKNYYK